RELAGVSGAAHRAVGRRQRGVRLRGGWMVQHPRPGLPSRLAALAVLIVGTTTAALLALITPPTQAPVSEVLVRWQPAAIARGMPAVPPGLAHAGRLPALGIDVYRADAAEAEHAVAALRRDP